MEEVVEITMGQSPSSKNYTNNSSDHILVQGNADMKNGHVEPRVWTTQITKQAKKGDLILSVRAPVGDIGKTDYDVVIGRGVAAIKGNEYIFQVLIKMKDSGYWTRFSTGSTFESINSSNIRNAQIMIPKDDEQTKIAKVLTFLDNTLQLHERKCEELTLIKRALLQKLFPKKDEFKPEVRYKNFSDAWEQRKITELGKIYIGLVTTMTEHYVNKGTLLIRNSDIKEGKFEFGENPIFLDESFSEKNKSRMHQIGDVITVHTGDIGTSAVITEREANSIGFATIVTRPKKEVISSQYLCTFLNTEQHKKWALSVSTGDGRNNYNLKDYYRLRVPTPSIEEQQCISDFVGNLDTLITLHQRKLEKLKQLKKFLLQNMLI